MMFAAGEKNEVFFYTKHKIFLFLVLVANFIKHFAKNRLFLKTVGYNYALS